MEEVGKIVKVAGPLVIASNIRNAKIYDVVRVSEQRLMGEIIEMRGDEASIQVYEETGGLGVGEPVYPTGVPLSVELGPGLIESIYDGVQRPLDIIREQAGDLITRGINIPGLNREKKWKLFASNPEISWERRSCLYPPLFLFLPRLSRILRSCTLTGRLSFKDWKKIRNWPNSS